MLFSKAIEGFLMYAESGAYSPSYIPTMKIQLNYMCKHMSDPEIEQITERHWQEYFHHLHTEYQPKRFNGDTSPLSPATIDNHWKTMRGFYNWVVDTLEISRVDLKIPRPKYDSPEIVPFTEDEVKRILGACQYTKVVKQSGRTYRIKRPNSDRDRAIILIFLDTGVRLGEFGRLKNGDVNLESGEIYIRPYRTGRKSKARTVFIGIRTKEAIWKYIAKQQAKQDQSQPLFPLKPVSIRLLLNRIGKNASVKGTHPQRFRDTFATNYYRNCRDPFALQRTLGHSDIKMTMKYVHLVESDIASAHRIASPVDNWKL